MAFKVEKMTQIGQVLWLIRMFWSFMHGKTLQFASFAKKIQILAVVEQFEVGSVMLLNQLSLYGPDTKT